MSITKIKIDILMIMYAIHLIENMADTTSIIDSTVSFYLDVPTVVGVSSQDINGVY